MRQALLIPIQLAPRVDWPLVKFLINDDLSHILLYTVLSTNLQKESKNSAIFGMI